MSRAAMALLDMPNRAVACKYGPLVAPMPKPTDYVNATRQNANKRRGIDLAAINRA